MRRLCTIAVLALLFSTTFSLGAVGNIEKPTYEMGNRWVYLVTLEYDEVSLDGEVTTEVIGEQEVLGHSVWMVRMEGGGTTPGIPGGTWETSIAGYYRKSDLATVKTEGYLSVTYNSFGLTRTARVEMEETYSPPMDSFDYPIKMHESWTATSTSTTTTVTKINGIEVSSETETETIIHTVECLRERSMTVDAGTFAGYEIKKTKEDGSYSIMLISEEVGAEVISEEFESDGSKVGTMVLVSYDYEAIEGVSGSAIPFWVIVFGIILMISIVMILIVALIAWRKVAEMPQQPQQYYQQQQYQQPYQQQHPQQLQEPQQPGQQYPPRE